jgi:hypothetical protein
MTWQHLLTEGWAALARCVAVGMGTEHIGLHVGWLLIWTSTIMYKRLMYWCCALSRIPAGILRNEQHLYATLHSTTLLLM